LLRARDYTPRNTLPRAIARARELGARSLDVESHRQLDGAKIAAAHAAGLNIYVWTVNRISTARRLAAAGIDGITTDRCAWMTAQLDR
jgi:glycerophosphoryl diester phosphodiesterase